MTEKQTLIFIIKGNGMCVSSGVECTTCPLYVLCSEKWLPSSDRYERAIDYYLANFGTKTDLLEHLL